MILNIKLPNIVMSIPSTKTFWMGKGTNNLISPSSPPSFINYSFFRSGVRFKRAHAAAEMNTDHDRGDMGARLRVSFIIVAQIWILSFFGVM